MIDIRAAAAPICGGTAVLAAVLAVGASGLFAWWALGLGTLGVLFVLAGLLRGSDRGITFGAVALFLGAMLAGIEGAPALPVLVSATAAIVSWELGRYALGVERQLGAEASTIRLEAVHATGTLSVGVVTIGIGYGIFATGTGEQPMTALAFLLVAAVLLVVAMR